MYFIYFVWFVNFVVKFFGLGFPARFDKIVNQPGLYPNNLIAPKSQKNHFQPRNTRTTQKEKQKGRVFSK